jgi:hypothetical protein
MLNLNFGKQVRNPINQERKSKKGRLRALGKEEERKTHLSNEPQEFLTHKWQCLFHSNDLKNLLASDKHFIL